MPRLHFQYTERSTKPHPRHPNRIRHYRLQARLSQRQLGASLGRGRTAVSCWERGLSCPPAPVLLRLAKRLDTLVESLYYDIYAADRYFDEDESDGT